MIQIILDNAPVIIAVLVVCILIFGVFTIIKKQIKGVDTTTKELQDKVAGSIKDITVDGFGATS